MSGVGGGGDWKAIPIMGTLIPSSRGTETSSSASGEEPTMLYLGKIQGNTPAALPRARVLPPKLPEVVAPTVAPGGRSAFARREQYRMAERRKARAQQGFEHKVNSGSARWTLDAEGKRLEGVVETTREKSNNVILSFQSGAQMFSASVGVSVLKFTRRTGTELTLEEAEEKLKKLPGKIDRLMPRRVLESEAGAAGTSGSASSSSGAAASSAASEDAVDAALRVFGEESHVGENEESADEAEEGEAEIQQPDDSKARGEAQGESQDDEIVRKGRRRRIQQVEKEAGFDFDDIFDDDDADVEAAAEEEEEDEEVEDEGEQLTSVGKHVQELMEKEQEETGKRLSGEEEEEEEEEEESDQEDVEEIRSDVELSDGESEGEGGEEKKSAAASASRPIAAASGAKKRVREADRIDGRKRSRATSATTSGKAAVEMQPPEADLAVFEQHVLAEFRRQPRLTPEELREKLSNKGYEVRQPVYMRAVRRLVTKEEVGKRVFLVLKASLR